MILWLRLTLHTLPPELTLEKGLESIKHAVGKLKLNPPSTSNGFFRSQRKSFGLVCLSVRVLQGFPSVFMSKETVINQVVLPPQIGKQSGRPRKKKIQSQGEERHQYRCGRCKQIGHSSGSCSAAVPFDSTTNQQHH
nr:uncharacterized protein LOC125422253 [Ziziphus jujuba var. spinosa]